MHREGEYNPYFTVGTIGPQGELQNIQAIPLLLIELAHNFNSGEPPRKADIKDKFARINSNQICKHCSAAKRLHKSKFLASYI